MYKRQSLPCRHRGEHDVGPWRALGPEAAADVLGGDDDPLLRHGEQPGEHGLYGTGALTGRVHGQPAVVPAGGAGVRLHGVVVQRRHPVRDVHPGGRGPEGPVGVALFTEGRMAAVGLLGHVHARVRGGELHVVLFGVVGDADRGGTGPGRLQGLGHHQGHEPAPVRNPRVLEHGERRIVRLGEPRRVLVGEDGEDTGHGQGRRRVDAGHPAPGDSRRHGPGLGPAGGVVLGGVAGAAADLLPSLPALGGRAHAAGHGVLLVSAWSASRDSTSTARLRASGTL